MIKRFFSVVLIVFLLSVPAFATSNDVYDLELDTVEAPTMLSLAAGTIAPLAATSWDTSDQSNLSAIRNAFYNPNTGYVSNSLLGWVKKLADNYQPSPFDSDSVLELTQIKSAAVVNLPYLQNINTYISNLDMVDDILNDTSTLQFNSSTISSLLSGWDTFISNISSKTNTISSYVTDLRTIELSNMIFGYRTLDGVSKTVSGRPSAYLGWTGVALNVDGISNQFGDRTLYSRLKQLQEVLASDDDLALANSQLANREEIENSFLSGSSGGSSLGASDFGALSGIGGSFKDTVSLNGQSSISDLMDGLASADESGQGWFSASTKDALDTVSSAASYSLRNDPYNMVGWEERYAWLNGG